MHEGVIKFELNFQKSACLPQNAYQSLSAWFIIGRKLGLLGQDPNRYQGYAWGNLSQRWQNGFVITCTQVSGLAQLGPEQFTWVSDFDLSSNRLSCSGPCSASSESMSHGAIYDHLPEVQAVFHAHHPLIWHQASRLGLMSTDPQIEYGTPEMARAIQTILDKMNRPSSGLMRMGGHKDGVIAWGKSIEQSSLLLIRALAQAMK